MQNPEREAVTEFRHMVRQQEMLTEAEFRLFRDLIYEECGISFGPEKRLFMESRLRRRMDDLGIKTAFEYYQVVKHSADKTYELPALLDILMICETSFFRNQPQFDLFMNVVLPEVIAKKDRAGARSLRVWSAGCSTGQEPYSAVMAILNRLIDSSLWNVRVYGSDLSFTALERAQCGSYRPDQVKGVDDHFLQKYFRRQEGTFLIADHVKRHVVFDYHNLKHDNGLRGMDIVFCRNVLIYFDMDEQRRLINRFAASLLPGGFLFLGHAESLQGLSTRFSMVHKNKGIAYRLEG